MYKRLTSPGFGSIMAMIGPIAVAGSHFAVSAALIPNASPEAFGTFAFAMVVMQVVTGISDGIIGSPMAVITREGGSSNINIFRSVNLLYCAVAFFLTWVTLCTFVNFPTATLLSLFISIMAYRWFWRAVLFQQGRKVQAWIADTIYSAVVMVLLLSLLIGDVIYLWTVAVCLLASAIVTTPVFLSTRETLQPAVFLTSLRCFKSIWLKHSRWSLLGVGANALAIEAHVFVVSFIAGPEAFAPVAIAALLYRPTLIGIYSIAQIERPRISKVMQLEGIPAAVRETRAFTVVLSVLWLCNSLAAAAAIYGGNHLIRETYDVALVTKCALLLGAVMLLRSARHPLLVLLQAMHQFRAIAYVTAGVAPLSIGFTAIGLHFGDLPGSILGLLIADIVLSIAVYTLFRRQHASPPLMREPGLR